MLKFINLLVNPDTLETDDECGLSVLQANGFRPVYVPVTFVRYDPFLAIVVGKDGDGSLMRIEGIGIVNNC